jgi:hypothetical protein
VCSRNPSVRRRPILRIGNISSTSHIDRLFSASLTATKHLRPARRANGFQFHDTFSRGRNTFLITAYAKRFFSSRHFERHRGRRIQSSGLPRWTSVRREKVVLPNCKHISGAVVSVATGCRQPRTANLRSRVPISKACDILGCVNSHSRSPQHHIGLRDTDGDLHGS